jgi:hypothetical protein
MGIDLAAIPSLPFKKINQISARKSCLVQQGEKSSVWNLTIVLRYHCPFPRRRMVENEVPAGSMI